MMLVGRGNVFKNLLRLCPLPLLPVFQRDAKPWDPVWLNTGSCLNRSDQWRKSHPFHLQLARKLCLFSPLDEKLATMNNATGLVYTRETNQWYFNSWFYLQLLSCSCEYFHVGNIAAS